MQTIKDVMSQNVEVISPSATLNETARKMKNQNVGVLPVCDGKKLQGMITDRDVVTRALAENRDPNRTEVNEVMTREVDYCFEDQNVEDAVELMQEKKIRRLVIVDRDKNLSGVLSIDDLATEIGKEHLAGETLKEVSTSRRFGIKKSRSSFKQSSFMWALIPSVIGLGAYLLFNQRSNLLIRAKNVIPRNRNRADNLLKAS